MTAIHAPRAAADLTADWTIVTRAQAGDMDAFADIYRAHHDRIMRFVQHRISNRTTAEDITSETFAKALRYIGTVTWQGRDIGAWLMTLARNLVADHFKSARTRTQSRSSIDDLIAERHEFVADDDTEAEVAQSLSAQEAMRLIGPLLPELTVEQLAVIRLRFFDGLSTVETAAAMGKQVGAVKAAQSRACSSMRRRLLEVAS